ncbi:THO complex subunit 4 [Gracilariopsis chorda]|uniref:THO complex subunit 4 n=1 Tax=Gracilariopsis chorda TaxID=448386 RepID=A0A2V3J1D7_9FLOR|nr:THO complex subunit 4 [Gracilariopsis chorda]|eukprot:PXF48226.1 THO complex subunit 4 [Gracilariopsis chorda]
MMNIDRPLDDIIKESLEAKRADRAARRRDQGATKRKAPNNKSRPPASAPPKERSPEKDATLPAAKSRRSITKKRRTRRKPNNNNASSPPDSNGSAEPAPATASAPMEPAPHYLSSSAQRRSNGVKVVVSNLHPGVTQSDIAELFETVGPLKSAVLPRYPSGTSTCEAEVIFENMPDALEAIKRYNLVPLDNQPLQITLVTTRSKNSRDNAPKKSQPVDAEYRDHSRSPGEPFERKDSPFADRNRNGQQGRRQNRRRNRRQFRGPAPGPNQDREDRDRRDDRDGYAD